MTTQAMQPTVEFPHFSNEVQRLVDRHLELKDEPLLLAIYYKPRRDLNDVFLFEVIEDFGGGAIDPDRELFEVTYNSTAGFPLEPGQSLHLVLTNPREFVTAVSENWSGIDELRRAIEAREYRTLYSDSRHANLAELINA